VLRISAVSEKSSRINGRVRQALPRLDARTFWRQTMLLLVALALFNAGNYAFHVVVSRLLGPSDYGALASLLAVVMVLSVPFGVLQTVVAQRTASLRARGREDEVSRFAAAALKTINLPAWAAALLIVAVGAPAFAAFLDLGYGAAVLLAPYLLFSMLSAVAFGVLQGELRFGAIATLLMAGLLVRLGVGIGLVAGGLGVAGAVLATAIAPAVTLVIGLRLVQVDRKAWRAARRSFRNLGGSFAAAAFGLTSFWLFAEVDIALARHFLPHDEAGYYSSAGLLTRALLFLPAAISVVAFPRFVAARERGEGHTRWLRVSLAGFAILLVPAVLGLILLREPLVSLAFSDRYAHAVSLVPALAFAMAVMAVIGLLVYFHIAMSSRAYLLVLGGVAVECVLIAFFHETPRQIAYIVLIVASAVCLLEYLAAASLCRWRPSLDRADAERLSAEPASLELSVVLPCHNAAAGLADVLHALSARLERVESYELIVVSDGSTDETVAIAEGFGSERVRVLRYDERTGKGNALRVGLTESRGKYVAFLDADGDIAPDTIGSFLELMKLYEPDIVLGSKRHPLSEVHYPPLRRLLSWTYHRIARLLFRVDVRDTQTGAKLIRRDVLAAVLPRLLEKRYAFDLEFLVVARALGFKRVFEAPVRIEYRFASQVNPAETFRILVDTAAIFYRHYILDTYRQAGRHPRVAPFTPATPLPAPLGLAETQDRRPARLRILFLNWRDIRNPEAGGAEIFAHEVSRRWVAQGHEVTLLTSGFRGASREELIDGVRVRRLGRLRRGTFHLLVQRELARLRGFDAVLEGVNTVPFLTPLWRWRLPPTITLIYQIAVEVWDEELPRPFSSVARWIEPRLLRAYRDSPVVTISESGREELLRAGLRDVAVVEPGRDDAPPRALEVEKEVVPTFLYVGRLAANKRPEHAVEAFKTIRTALPDARLWIVGRGPLDERLARSLPDGAQLLGYLGRDELFDRMARAHCLLVPSVREGWGMVVVEANSVGTPSVGYDVPGIRDSIRHGETGWLTNAGDPAGLARAAVDLLHDPSRHARACVLAREWASDFSWDRTAAQLAEALDAQRGVWDSVARQTTAGALTGAGAD
jgi:glycosyltransferase involved in cell wall biosynthesis/O-antigen/teichoic acid export membrane protein